MRIAINGFGRIGRHFFRGYLEAIAAGKAIGFEVVLINDIAPPDVLVHLLNFDSSHGRLATEAQLASDNKRLTVAEQNIPFTQCSDPESCDWQEHDIDIVIEATGQFRAYADAQRHIASGAKRVILAAVPFDTADNVVVYGVNHQSLSASDKVISAASCTTHCITPLLNLLNQHWGLEQVMMTEVHAYTSDQQVLDHAHRDWRRARSAAQNLIPTTTSSISAVQQILPFLNGRISGYSMRVPTPNVACVDLTVLLTSPVCSSDIHEKFKIAAEQNPSFLGYNTAQLVSSDFNGRKESAIFDATLTQPQDSSQPSQLFKLFAWYDNEIGYANRLIDLLHYLSGRKNV